MKKRIILLFLCLIPLPVWGIELNSPNYIIYDRTENKVLESQNEKEETAIASLTKIMSALVIIEERENLEEEVTITWDMLNQVPYDAYQIHLKVGNTYTVKELLYATILPSAADAVTALAVHHSGSVESFVERMNEKAKVLGLENTHFTNPIGMDDPNNKTTLEETLIFLNKALENETFKTIYEAKEYTLSDGKIINSSVSRFSKNLGVDISRIKGAKTGTTGEAGYCLSQIFDSNNHEILSITTKAEQDQNSLHIKDGLTIIAYMDENYKDQLLLEKNAHKKKIKVIKSKIKEVEVSNEIEIKKYLRNDYDPNLFHIEENVLETIDYKTNKNIGTFDYYYQNELITKEDILVKEEIEPTIWEIIKTSIWTYISLGILLMIGIFSLLKRKKNKKRK